VPTTDWKEVIPPDEPSRLEAVAQRLAAVQARRDQGGEAGRTLHLKGHLGVEGTFEVLDGLPAHARVGLFAAPATYRTLVRFSNGTARRQADRKPNVRGVALKVLGVPGKKVIPGMEAARTQDFLMNRTRTQPFTTADDFAWFIEATQSPATFPLKALARFGPVRGLKLLIGMLSSLGQPIASAATTSYFSGLPIRFGELACKYALFPLQADAPRAKPGRSPDHLGEELSARLAKEPVVYDFKVQFFESEATTPIEDASKEWREDDAPFVTVGRLTLPAQDVGSARGRKVAALVESLSFDPWHALECFRPLGHMMRARNHAYRVSTQTRNAAPEPADDVLESLAA
jgi:hypothetical protein